MSLAAVINWAKDLISSAEYGPGALYRLPDPYKCRCGSPFNVRIYPGVEEMHIYCTSDYRHEMLPVQLDRLKDDMLSGNIRAKRL